MTELTRLPALDLTRDLRGLAQLASTDEGLEDLVCKGLDWLGRLAPYDLATLFELDGTTLVVRAARGRLADDRVRAHRIALAQFPTVREVIETRHARAFTEADHAHGDGDPFAGVVDLVDGHACMVVPLVAGDRAYGVLTLDRSKCEVFPQQVVDLVEVYAQMLALALVNAEQRRLLERLRDQRQEQVRLLEHDMVGDSPGVFEESRAPKMKDVARRARQVAPTDTAVLILGETGTGKERLARALHEWSQRRDGPFVKMNCAAIPAGLLESELFGHVRGGFTGATRDRAGRFQTANGGTILLDEIGELPLELQAKLLRVLQEGTFESVGSDRTLKVDVRVLASTHVNLEEAVARGRFRADLYYRLNVFPLVIPALRERFEDLETLCRGLVDDQARRTGRRGMRVTPEALARLRQYPWPGNIRELGNVLERAMILAPGQSIGPELIDLPTGPVHALLSAPTVVSEQALSPLVTLEEAEREHIRAVLAHTQGKLYGAGGAAEILGMKPSTLQSRMKKLGVARGVNPAR